MRAAPRVPAISSSPSSSYRVQSAVGPFAAVRRRHCCPLTIVRSRHIGFNASNDDHNFSSSSNGSPKYWDMFYKRHQNKFFKDRHYIEKDWGQYFSAGNTTSANGKVVLEVGCGAGNSIFPLITSYPNLFVHACDFSPHAVALVKSHADFNHNRINAFLCDAANDDLCHNITPSSVDVVTLIFMLSAVCPTKMPLVIQNLRKVLKPKGHVLLRDYAVGDYAQIELQNRNKMMSDNFYVRGDGTCSFFFSEDYLLTLFQRAGFSIVDMNIYCRQIHNRSRDVTMSRRWIRAIFSLP